VVGEESTGYVYHYTANFISGGIAVRYLVSIRQPFEVHPTCYPEGNVGGGGLNRW
jgi:hypothetical protein